MSNITQQLQKMKSQPGFIAALDQSGGSTPKALRSYGIREDAWSNEEEMFAVVHQMAERWSFCQAWSEQIAAGRIKAGVNAYALQPRQIVSGAS